MKKRFGSSIVEQIERENNPTAQAAFANMSAQRSIFSSEVFSKLISLFFSITVVVHIKPYNNNNNDHPLEQLNKMLLLFLN